MRRISINPWPNGHTAAVIIRDDDVSYFTPPYKIEQVYKKAWKQGFKVSLGVIPNVRAMDDPLVPPSHKRKSSLHKLHDNEELAEYLKRKLIAHEIDIAQHGYTHEMLKGVPEFCINDSHEIRARLEAGRRILEECLPTKISVFIAPWGNVSKQAWNILKEQRLALSGQRKDFGSLFSKIQTMAHRIYIRGFHPSKRKVVRFSDMIELHHSFDWWSNKHRSFIFNEERVEEAKEEFEKIMVAEDMFCLVNHYHGYYRDWQDEIDPQRLYFFHSILDFVNGHNVWKTTLSQVASWIKKMEEIEIDVDAEKMVLKSSTTIQGLTIKAEGCKLIPANDADVIVNQRKDKTFLVYKKLELGETRVASVDIQQ